jgi:hypothetical protein
MKMCGGGGTDSHTRARLTSAVDGGESAALCSGQITPGEKPRYPWIGGWMGPRASLDAVAKGKERLYCP